MLIISELSMGGRLCTFHDTDWVFAGQFSLVSPTSLTVRHPQDAPSPASLVLGPGSEITESRSRRLSCLASADVGLAACLRVWTLISLSVKLKIIIVIFRPRPKSPSLGSCQDPASSPCLLSAVCSASDDHSIKAWGSLNLRLSFFFLVLDDIFRCEVSVNQRIPTHYRLPPLYLTWN